MADSTYQDILKSYEDRPSVQLIRRIRGKKALQAAAAVLDADAAWLGGWSDAEKKGARGFLYTRKLRKGLRYGFKLVSLRGGEESILGHEVAEAVGPALVARFR